MGRFALMVATLGAIGVSTVTGCASPSASNPTTAHVAQPEVVAIDVFANGNGTASCSGTLLAPTVVLTAAHCMTSGSEGFVNAPDASGQATSAIKTVHLYDWTANGDHSVQHDLAVVVLAKKITIATYPKVWSHNADGLNAIQSRRTSVVALDSSVAQKTVGINKGRPVNNTFTLYVPDASSDAGGGLFGTDSNGNRELIGVMLGKGTTTAGGYAARVADPTVRAWIANIVANPNATTPPTAYDLSKMNTLDDDDDDGSSSDASGSDDDFQQGNETQQGNENQQAPEGNGGNTPDANQPPSASSASSDDDDDQAGPETMPTDPQSTTDTPPSTDASTDNVNTGATGATDPQQGTSTPAATATATASNDGIVPAGIDAQTQGPQQQQMDPTDQQQTQTSQQQQTIQQQMTVNDAVNAESEVNQSQMPYKLDQQDDAYMSTDRLEAK